MIDGARRRRIEKAYLQALLVQCEDAGMPDPAAIHVALQALERIAEMLAGLPAKTREAFLLSRLDGLTYSEIATRLEVSPSTVKTTCPPRWCIATTACTGRTRCRERRADHSTSGELADAAAR